MKKLFLSFLLVTVCNFAFSAEIKDTGAKNLITAMKLSGIVPKNQKQIIDYSLEYIDCHTANAFSDGLTAYDCNLNKEHKIYGAPAKMLYDALVASGLEVDAAMSQTHVTAGKINCRIILSPAPIYICRYSTFI